MNGDALTRYLVVARLTWADLTVRERESLCVMFKDLVADGEDRETAARMTVEALLEDACP